MRRRSGMFGTLKPFYLLSFKFKTSNQTAPSGTQKTMESHSKVHLKK